MEPLGSGEGWCRTLAGERAVKGWQEHLTWVAGAVPSDVVDPGCRNCARGRVLVPGAKGTAGTRVISRAEGVAVTPGGAGAAEHGTPAGV